MRRALTVGATIFALLYLGACWYLYAHQRELIYFGWATQAPVEGTDYALQRPDAMLRGWLVNADKPDPILYFGGNAESVEQNRDDFAKLFPQRSVYLVAYRGYGASEGAPSQDRIVPDALAIFDDVQRRHPGQRIAVLGRSIGTGVASQLAAQRPVEKLALITPFDSMVGAGRAHYPIFPVSSLLDERYESDRALTHFDKPVLIVRGGRDDVVPPANTLRLIDALPKPPQVVLIAQAGHNDILGDPESKAALAKFLR